MTTPRKRIVTIKLSDRDKADPKAIMDAVRDALRKKNFELRVHNAPVESGDPVRQVALEQLEAAALTVAAKLLDDRARESVEPQQGKKRTPASPGTIAKARKKLWDWTCFLGKMGWEVTVKKALEKIVG